MYSLCCKRRRRSRSASSIATASDSHWPHPAAFIFADEFTSSLDRITAAVIAFTMRKRTRKNDKIFVLASSHEDILPDLQPDILIIKNLTGKTQTLYKDKDRNPVNRVVRKQKR